jgi:hypothetical protein
VLVDQVRDALDHLMRRVEQARDAADQGAPDRGAR